jgi:tetratricopeptide (TPR) repeat protein
MVFAQRYSPNGIRPMVFAQWYSPNGIRPTLFAQWYSPDGIHPTLFTKDRGEKMEKKDLLINLLKCPIAEERELLKNNSQLVDSQFVSILQQASLQAQEHHRSSWAKLQYLLGLVLIEIGRIEAAIACFRNALTVLIPNAFPLECTRVASNLGYLGYRQQSWSIAIEGYEKAIAGVEVNRSRTNTDERRQQILRESLNVYSYMVEACV